MSIELHQAFNVLAKSLKEDKDYRNSWLANISVQVQDSFDKRRQGGVYNPKEIGDEAADNFLKLLTR